MLLNSLGELFYFGVLDGETGQPESHILRLASLTFPPAYPPATRHRYEPDTAIRQYSVGRSHVMGLSDSGKMWEWANGSKAGMLVKLVSVDVAEGAKVGKGRVTRVVSGTVRLVLLIILFTHEGCRLGEILRIHQRHGYRVLGANS